MAKKVKYLIILGVFFLLFFLSFMIIRVYLYCTGAHTLTEYVEYLEQTDRPKQNITVAVIDSGCNIPDGFEDRILEGYCFPGEKTEYKDAYGHGTKVVELILSNTPDEVKVLPLKVTDDDGYAEVEDVCSALEYAANQGVNIINLSLNAALVYTEESRCLDTLIEQLTCQGIQVVVSAGNTGCDVQNLFPASTKDAIVVASVDEKRIPYFFSGCGKRVDFCSYGRYGEALGTSYSAAYVTATVAILKMYGIENVDKILTSYAECYDKSEKDCGIGYIWLDSFTTARKSDASEDKEQNLQAFGFSQGEDMGFEILQMDWKKMAKNELEDCLLCTEKEYVGMFLKSLSKEDMTLLEELCPAIHSEVAIADCKWDNATKSYKADTSTTMDFAEYCIDLYENSICKMTISSWDIMNPTMVFYLANEDRTVKYRYEVIGNVMGKKAGDADESEILGKDGSLSLISFGLESPAFNRPFLDGTGIKTYVTDITSRWIAYAGPDVDNGRIMPKEYKEIHNTINYSDNGNIFYGISIPFTGATLYNKKGYHYGTNEIEGYRYNTNEMAVGRRYAHLTSTEWIYDDNPEVRFLAAGFQCLSNILDATSYTAKSEDSYRDCPDPTQVSLEEASEYYYINQCQIYKTVNQSSFDIERGKMTMNTAIYDTSSLEFFNTLNNRKIISNDIVEYVIAQSPDYYNVVLDANGGLLSEWGAPGTANPLKTVTAYYDSMACQNIGWIIPTREHYVFAGWYTEREGGDVVWDWAGNAQNGIFWQNGIWKYSHNWSERNNTLTFYAHWIPDKYHICFDPNGGTGYRENMYWLEYGREYALPANQYPNNGDVREGYDFSGWNTMPEGNGSGYDDMALFSRAFDRQGEVVLLYAQWKPHHIGPPIQATPKPPVTSPKPPENLTPPPAIPTQSPENPTPPPATPPQPPENLTPPPAIPTQPPENLTPPPAIPTQSPENPTPSPAVPTPPADTTPPDIKVEPPEEIPVESLPGHLIYGWTNREIPLVFTADDIEMDSVILYEGNGVEGTVLGSGREHVEYWAAEEGVFCYTLVAKDKSGNTSTLLITTKIDYTAPKGKIDVSYDGYFLDISLNNIVEENPVYPENEASGCEKAWILLEGLDEEKNIICEQKQPLTLLTPDNIYTGAIYGDVFELNDTFNYTSEYIRITTYIRDWAGNSIPVAEPVMIPAFVLKADLERCLGEAAHWKAGEAGTISVYAAAWVDSVEITYPSEWIHWDESLENHFFDYSTTGRENEKREEELFYVPLRTDHGVYDIQVCANKNGYKKTVTFLVTISGTILDEIRTRLR